MKKILVTFFLITSLKFIAFSQAPNAAIHWADSVFNTLNDDQRIAQLMVLRESSYSKDGPIYYDSAITSFPGNTGKAGKFYQPVSKHFQNSLNGLH